MAGTKAGNAHGEFIWYELMTVDPDAAADFYGAVLGWETHDLGQPTGGYRAFRAADTDVAGLLTMPEEAACTGAVTTWLGYIGVDDADEAAEGIVAAGGVRHVPPMDIPGVGRFAMLADPQGAAFYVMRGAVEGHRSRAFSPSETGHCQWNELATTDQAGALDFYRGRFGWSKGDVMPMGEMGDYQFLDHGGETIGAVMTAMEPGAPSAWRFYFGVDDIDIAAKAVIDKGGKLLHGPAEVPTGDFIVIAEDPQGATFGLSGPGKG